MTQTHSTLPAANATFLPDLQAFLSNEDALRYQDMFTDFVVSGGVIATGAGFTKTPTVLTAYANGYYLTEVGSITFASAQTTFVIADANTTGNLAGFTRVSGTHYLTKVAPDEALPDGAIRIATVTTDGAGVTAVLDTRVRFAISQAQGGLSQDISLAPNGTLLIGNGAGMVQALLTQGVGISITNGAGSITLDAGGISSWHVHGNRSFVATVTTFTLAAQSVTLRKSDNTTVVVHAPGNITNTVTTSGPVANGRDQVAAFTIDTFVHFYWIWNGSVLASVSSPTAPPTGPVLPTGYTHWGYCGAIRFNNISNLVPMHVMDDWCYFEAGVNVLAAGAAVAETGVTISFAVPANATQFRVGGQARVQNSGGGASDVTATLRYITAKDFFKTRIQGTNSGNWNSNAWEVTIPNIGLMYLWNNNTNATNALDLDVLGYKVA